MMAVPRPTYAIVEMPKGSDRGFEAYGNGITFWKCRDHEVMFEGPSETGKTITALHKLVTLVSIFPNSRAIIVRKTYKSCITTVLQTFERKVLGPDSPVKAFGGHHPEFYQFPNGSRIYVGGMDHPDRILSSEWDFIYINQAEELTISDYEVLTTRATGRAGNAPYSQVLADCNPGGPKHWILQRADAGKLTIIHSRHEDNPTLYDPETGEITGQGRRTLRVLDDLTGVRYLRLRKGLWVAAEGVIYDEFDTAVHLIDPFPIPADWPRVRAIDFGYTNPFVCQWWAIDPDRRLYLYRELYATHQLVEDIAEEIVRLSRLGISPEPFQCPQCGLVNPVGGSECKGCKAPRMEPVIATVADHDAEDRATLEKHGVRTVPAMKLVKLGIQAVQSRLRKTGDGMPRLFIFRDALVRADPLLREKKLPLCTEQEIPEYAWTPTKDGLDKEQPMKKSDHGMDAMRYLVCLVDGIRPVEEVRRVFTLEDDYEV